MGWVVCDGVFYGDRPHRGIGTEGCAPTVFDAHAMASARVMQDTITDALAYADLQFKLRCRERRERNVRL